MSQYLDFAKDAAYRAGEIMRENFHPDVETELKADYSPVSVADKAINQLIIDMVKDQFPDHSVRGEEDSNLKDGPHTWVCDPIDGTIYYTMGVAIGTFMLSLVSNGEPQVGVIYEPVTDKLVYAEKNSGAYLNSRRINVSNDSELGPGKRFDMCDIKDHPVLDLRPIGDDLYNKGVKVTGIRASGMVGMLVAQGHLIAAMTPSSHPHDVAALKIIVEEAGGKVTDITGKDQKYDTKVNGAIISNGAVHDELVSIVQKNT